MDGGTATPVKTVVITWMDDRQYVYHAAYINVREGVLLLDQDKFPASSEPARRFPLANIRTWTVDEQ